VRSDGCSGFEGTTGVTFPRPFFGKSFIVRHPSCNPVNSTSALNDAPSVRLPERLRWSEPSLPLR
ncbi:MAG: hypothetical protein V7776_23850, partial [Halopseudomonas aestusnigri]